MSMNIIARPKLNYRRIRICNPAAWHREWIYKTRGSNAFFERIHRTRDFGQPWVNQRDCWPISDVNRMAF